MMHLLRLCLLASVLTAPPVLGKEVMYVTDRVIADLHAKPEAGGALLVRLPTGTRVSVLGEMGRYTHVRLGNGTEGWMKTSKLQEERPAQLLLLALSEQQEYMAAEMQSLRKELAALHQQEAAKPLASLVGREVPPWAPVVIVVLALLFGFAMGVLWLDRRIRERHGGFRV